MLRVEDTVQNKTVLIVTDLLEIVWSDLIQYRLCSYVNIKIIELTYSIVIDMSNLYEQLISHHY